jgi:hypothetical protein
MIFVAEMGCLVFRVLLGSGYNRALAKQQKVCDTAYSTPVRSLTGTLNFH